MGITRIPAIRWLSVVTGIGAAAVALDASPIVAQTSAVVAVVSTAPQVRYARNESGGRISVMSQAPDTGSVESVRVLLFESAAAIRRGDFEHVQVLERHPEAMQFLAERRDRIRCTVRMTARGGDLVLLSDDDGVVAAIHQLLALTPPGSIRL